MENWTVKQIVLPVDDIDSAVGFYTGLGFRMKFQDGDRYAALDGGNVTIALVAKAEDITNGRVALGVAVDDLKLAVEKARAAGAELVKDIASGPDESRAVLSDPKGHLFVLYKKT